MVLDRKVEKRKYKQDKTVKPPVRLSVNSVKNLNGVHEDENLLNLIVNDNDSTDEEKGTDSEIEDSDSGNSGDDNSGEDELQRDDNEEASEDDEDSEDDGDSSEASECEDESGDSVEDEENIVEEEEEDSDEDEEDSHEEVEEESSDELKVGSEKSKDDEDNSVVAEGSKGRVHGNKTLKHKSKIIKKLPNKNDNSNNVSSIKEGNKEGEGLPIQESSKNSTHDPGPVFAKLSIKPKFKESIEKDIEYQTDTSDEEDIRNTVGNIPMKWYNDYPHLGYDWDGKKIVKPNTGDELDNFLKKMEDPNFWRTVKDPQTGQDVVLCDADVDQIQRLQSQKIPDEQFDDYAPWIDWFSSEVMKTPLRKFPEHKRSFLPSKSEKEKVGRIVHALKMGWIKPRRERPKKKAFQPEFYMLWKTDEEPEEMRRIHNHIPAPKRLLPGHAESYNPPPEFLFDEMEMEEWEKFKETPSKRKLHFIPQKYNSLREVPAYDRYIKERFLRCLDLYLCPRARKLRLTIEPEDLVPQLPSPKDLQPFPTTQAIVYKGHTDMVRTITVEPKGQYLVSGSDDMTIKVWEVCTGRCVRTIPVGGVVRCVSWCPSQALSLVAVAADRKVLLINPGVGDRLVCTKTDSLLEEPPAQDIISSDRVTSAVSWEQPSEENWKQGIRVIINHFKEVRQVAWHGRGDYFATVMPEGQNRSVLVHQLSKQRSQLPFSKSKGLIQCVLFHPVRPFFFVATQRNVRIYDLAKQEMVKKLLSNSKWISSMAIHPGGDNLLVGTYDRKLLWFDLDLSTQPYHSLRLHGSAVRGVAYHKRYPLFASGSDDRNLIVSHGMVYNDLLQNPLLVPLKRLSYHSPRSDFGIFDVLFHPTQPWVFSSASDHTVRLYS